MTDTQTNETTDTGKRGRRNEMVGEVTSDKMSKSITVSIIRRIRHRRYGKYIHKTKTFRAHDETNDAKTGDTVLIYETRPLSKTKRWKLAKVIERAKTVGDKK